MKTFALAVLASAVCAAEWGNPYGDYYSGYKNISSRGARRASPAMPRFGGPDRNMYGPRRPTPRYGAPAPRLGRPSPRGLFGKGYGANAANVIGDGIGDGYGHGRGFAKDDGANLEVDLVDRDREFEIEANMRDADIERDLEIELADRDIERELEDRRDHTINDGTLYKTYGGYYGYGAGYGDIGHGSVRQIGLIQNLGEREKRLDQSYNLHEGRGYVEKDDSGLLNRGGYLGYGGYGGYGYGYGKNGNRNKSYQDMRNNQGTRRYDRIIDDDVGRGVGISNNIGLGVTQVGYGNRYDVGNRRIGYGGYGGYGYGGSSVVYGQAKHQKTPDLW